MEELGRPGNDDVVLKTAQQPGIRDQFQPAQAVEGAQTIGQDTELRLGGDRLSPHVDAMDARAAGVGKQQSCRN